MCGCTCIWHLAQAQQLLAKEVCALKEEAAVTLGHAASQKAEYEVRIAEAMAAAEMRVVEYQSRWRAEFDRRRALHDALVELKGNIRVMARIRPLLATESAVSQGAATVEVQDEGTLVVRVPSERTARSFELDRVFSPEEDQDAVFGHVWELVTSALDGFNVCLMAYGQTGSGKTFTMEGTLDKPGVNTRALQELYRCRDYRVATGGEGQVAAEHADTPLEACTREASHYERMVAHCQHIETWGVCTTRSSLWPPLLQLLANTGWQLTARRKCTIPSMQACWRSTTSRSLTCCPGAGALPTSWMSWGAPRACMSRGYASSGLTA